MLDHHASTLDAPLMIRSSTDNMRNRELRDPQFSKESAVPDDPVVLARESDILVDDNNLTTSLCHTSDHTNALPHLISSVILHHSVYSWHQESCRSLAEALRVMVLEKSSRLDNLLPCVQGYTSSAR